MTDKELKQLLITSHKTDEEFVQRIMHQLPQKDRSWQPVWTIRIIALFIGTIVLIFSHELGQILHTLALLAHGSWTMVVTAGLVVTATTLWICRNRELI